MGLPRLTPAMLRKAERAGKTAGWYELCRQGYMPGEIAVHAEPVVFEADVRTRVREHADGKTLPIPATCARRIVRERGAPPEDWRAAFRARVMRTGMTLSLTQPMLDYLCATAEDVLWDRFGDSTLARPNNGMATSRSLELRGLVRRKKVQGKIGDYSAYEELTQAGQLVVELLKVTGIFRSSDRALEKRHANK